MTPLTKTVTTTKAGPRQDLTSQDNYKPFMWLAEHLLSTHDKIHGCEVLIPETYFFCKGKPKFMVKTDKERSNFLTSVSQPEKLELTEIRKDLPLFVRNKKFKGLANDQQSGYPKSSSQNSNVEYSPDVARITYISADGHEPNVQIVAEKGVFKTFTIRKNAHYWKTVSMIQAVIPTKILLNQPKDEKKRMNYKFHFRVLEISKIDELEPIELRAYQIFAKI